MLYVLQKLNAHLTTHYFLMLALQSEQHTTPSVPGPSHQIRSNLTPPKMEETSGRATGKANGQ